MKLLIPITLLYSNKINDSKIIDVLNIDFELIDINPSKLSEKDLPDVKPNTPN